MPAPTLASPSAAAPYESDARRREQISARRLRVLRHVAVAIVGGLGGSFGDGFRRELLDSLEARHLDARFLRAADVDRRGPRLVAGCLPADDVRAGVDRHALVPQRRIDRDVAALDHEPFDLARIGHRDRQIRQLRFERARTGARFVLAHAVVRGACGRRGLEERRPRGRDLAVPLAAIGEVEQRADAASEPIGRFELGACFAKLAVLHQLLAFAKQGLGADVGVDTGLGARDRRSGEHGGEDETTSARHRDLRVWFAAPPSSRDEAESRHGEVRAS